MQETLMKSILVITILITGLGTVFFFPLDIKGKYTCFFHRIIDHSHPVSKNAHQENGHIHPANINPNANNKLSLGNAENHSRTEKDVIPVSHGSALLDRYMDDYAFRWWVSIGFFALSIIMWMNMRKKSRNYNSSIVIQ
jgi:hypothetical protein